MATAGRGANAAESHGQSTCTVEVSPSEVDVGTDLIIIVRASCPHGCDLTGRGVSIRDQDGTELATAELTESDDGSFVTDELVLKAPSSAGEQTYAVVLALMERDGIVHEETTTNFTFAVRAHPASGNVWGLPSAIPAGEPFKFKVGLKCSAVCVLAGRELAIVDHQGAEVAAGSLLDDTWPGTGALYYAEFDAKAPDAPGDYEWQVKISEADAAGMPHQAGTSAFALKIVAAPDFEVTVEAYDSEKQARVKGVHVLLHPYRALTDENGVARIKVAKGTYKLHVSGFQYLPHRQIINVTSDVSTRAELVVAPPDSPY
jgi:hypothetical protein